MHTCLAFAPDATSIIISHEGVNCSKLLSMFASSLDDQTAFASVRPHAETGAYPCISSACKYSTAGFEYDDHDGDCINMPDVVRSKPSNES